jgi:DNA mismatch repair ATPase MutS
MSPKEVVLDKGLFDNKEIKDILSKKYSLNIYFFDFKGDSKEKLMEHFGTSNLEGFYLENKMNAQKASAMLLEYLEMNQKSSLDFLKSISYERFDEFMGIDENTIKNLDLIYNFSTKSSTVGTLF